MKAFKLTVLHLSAFLWNKSEISWGAVYPEFLWNSPLEDMYVSVHSIAECLFRTCQPVTISDLVCPNEHDMDRNWSPMANCEMIMFRHPGMSLQVCMDNFMVCVSSKCSTCDTCLCRKTSFVQTPPMLVFNLGTSIPSLSPELSITCRTTCVCYTLRGVVYLDNEYFMSHVITSARMIWFHDGLLAGASLISKGASISLAYWETTGNWHPAECQHQCIDCLASLSFTHHHCTSHSYNLT